MVESSPSYRMVTKKIFCHACGKDSKKMLEIRSKEAEERGCESLENVRCDHCNSTFIEFATAELRE